jgi:hypothetical protein
MSTPAEFAAAGDAHRAHFVEHRGARILLLDFAGLEEEGVLRMIDEARRLIAAQPPGSVRTLTHVAGAQVLSPRAAGAFRDAAEQNAPFVRAGAVVGLSPQQRVVYEAVMLFSGRKLHAFDSIDEAMEWLVDAPHPDD